MTGFLGIDHPLIVTRDIERAARRYASLGFRVTPIGKHPWGTSTALAMFEGCALELVGLYDETLIDEKPVGDFRFGRFVRDDLAEREGISLLALHSEDAEGDAAVVQARGIACQGTIEFGRDVILPDGRRDRTATTLKILRADDLPRLSNFACHQHRPELIYVPEWLDHPNGASGIRGVTILAEREDHARVRARLAGLYGEEALRQTSGGLVARTGNGDFTVMDRAAAADRFGDLPPPLASAAGPCYIGIDVIAPSVESVMPFILSAALPHRRRGGSVVLTDASYFGNVFLTFVPSTSG